MNALTMNTRPGARRDRFAWLPWALAAVFVAHLVMERALHLYKAGPVLGHVLEACLALAVLTWVWRGLRRAEDLPMGSPATMTMDNEDVRMHSSFWEDFDQEYPSGYPAEDYNGSVPVDRATIY